MRASFAFALRRGTVRMVFGVGLLGVIWTALYKTWPWRLSRSPMLERRYVHLLPTSSPWDLPIAAAVPVLGLALFVLIYRHRSTDPLEPSEQAAILRGDERP